MTYKLLRITSLAALVLLAAGCVVAPAEYAGAARQGADFETAMVDYTDAAKHIAIASRTESLFSSLEAADPGADRLGLYTQTEQGILEGVTIYDAIAAHAALMRSYFVQLQLLASADVPATARDAAGGTATALQNLSLQMQADGILPVEAPTIAGEIVALGISLRQRRALAAELAENGPLIEEQIRLQIAAIDWMAEQLQRDRENVIAQQENRLRLRLVGESDDLEALQSSRETYALIIAKAARVRDTPSAGSRLLESWQSLLRRAAGRLSLEELAAEIAALADEVQDMEATATSLKSLVR
jgi:hypothetical protein